MRNTTVQNTVCANNLYSDIDTPFTIPSLRCPPYFDVIFISLSAEAFVKIPHLKEAELAVTNSIKELSSSFSAFSK